MNKLENSLKNILTLMLSAPAAMVQFKGKPNLKQAIIAGMLILLVSPIGVLAGDSPPVINITGSNPANVTRGQTYTDAGATAIDDIDVGLTDEINKTSNVDAGIVGTYYVNYSVVDSTGNRVNASRTVNVIMPVLTGSGDIIISFDDGWMNTYDVPRQILTNNGQQAVVFVNNEPILGGWGDYMSTTQLTALYNSGWDISSHSYTHGSRYTPVDESNPTQIMYQTQYLIRANNSELKFELGDSKDWLDANGYTRSSMFFAYPFGTYDNAGCITGEATGIAYNTSICGTNDLVKEIKAAGYYVGARSIDAYSWRHADKHPKYKLNDPDVLKMATLAIDETDASLPGAVMTTIDNTVKENGLLVITFHKVVDTTPGIYDYTSKNFTLISNYLKELNKTGKVNVTTFSKYFKVPEPIPTYVPGTPTLSTIAYTKNSINATWVDATGSKTNVFDVFIKKGFSDTGSWVYNYVNRSVDLTNIASGTPIHIEVTAINRSWGSTSKSTPLIIDTEIPLMDTQITEWSSDNKNLTMTWKYNSGAGIDSVEWYTVNGTTKSTNTNSSKNGTVSLKLMPRETGTLFVTGINSTTMLRTDTVNNTMTLVNNIPELSGISSAYTIYVGESLTINATAKDLDQDALVFTETGNGSINSTTGVYFFNETSVAKKFNMNITVTDGFNPVTVNFNISVENKPVTLTSTPGNGGGGGGSRSSSSSGGGGGGGGASMGSGETFDNIVKFENKDGYIQVGKDTTLSFTTINPGIYQVILSGQSQDISVRVENLKRHQNITTDVSGHALLYTNVIINSARVSGFSFSFKINKSEITDAGNVKAFVWNNGAWEQLDTKLISTSDNNVYFQVTATPAKLSRFAISEIAGSENVGTKLTMSSPKSSDVEAAIASETPTVSKMPGFEFIGAVFVISILYLRRRL